MRSNQRLPLPIGSSLTEERVAPSLVDGGVDMLHQVELVHELLIRGIRERLEKRDV